MWGERYTICAPTKHQPTQVLALHWLHQATEHLLCARCQYCRDYSTLKVFLEQPGKHTGKSESTIQYAKCCVRVKGYKNIEKGHPNQSGRVGEGFLGEVMLELSMKRWEIFSQGKKVEEGRKGACMSTLPFLLSTFMARKRAICIKVLQNKYNSWSSNSTSRNLS